MAYQHDQDLQSISAQLVTSCPFHRYLVDGNPEVHLLQLGLMLGIPQLGMSGSVLHMLQSVELCNEGGLFHSDETRIELYQIDTDHLRMILLLHILESTSLHFLCNCRL